MQDLSKRYSTFQNFCLDVLPNNEFIKLLQITPLRSFLDTIKSKKGSYDTTDTILQAVLDKAEVQLTDLKDVDIHKFKRFIEYFCEVLTCVE